MSNNPELKNPPIYHNDACDVGNRLLREKDAAELLAVAPKTLQQWRWRKVGPPAVRIGVKACRYRLSDLLDYLMALRVHVGGSTVTSNAGDDDAS